MSSSLLLACFFFFFFNDTATTEIYTLSLHDALPICVFARIQGGSERQSEYTGTQSPSTGRGTDFGKPRIPACPPAPGTRRPRCCMLVSTSSETARPMEAPWLTIPDVISSSPPSSPARSQPPEPCPCSRTAPKPPTGLPSASRASRSLASPSAPA